MKRILMTFLFSGLIFMTAKSEDPFRFDLGVQASPSLIYLWGSRYLSQNTTPTIGYMAGAHLQYNFRRIASIRTELNFDSKGAVENSGPGVTFQRSNFQYMTVPVLLRLSFGRTVYFFMNAGPYVGALLRNTVVTTYAGSGTVTTDFTTNYSHFDGGFTGGLGLGVRIARRLALSFEARQNAGLYNINRNTSGDGFQGTVRTSSTDFILALSIRLGRR